jgi:hypothetical protein
MDGEIVGETGGDQYVSPVERVNNGSRAFASICRGFTGTAGRRLLS